jgi:hypothetical protein
MTLVCAIGSFTENNLIGCQFIVKQFEMQSMELRPANRHTGRPSAPTIQRHRSQQRVLKDLK